MSFHSPRSCCALGRGRAAAARRRRRSGSAASAAEQRLRSARAGARPWRASKRSRVVLAAPPASPSAALGQRRASGRTWPCPCSELAAARASRPGSSQRRAGARSAARSITWNSGVRLEVALRLQLLDQLLERQVLVGVGVERRLAHPRQQLAEGRVAGEVGAQDQGVDEEADQPLDLARGCGWRSASRPARSVLAGVAVRAAAAKAASSVMNRRRPLAAGRARASAAAQLRGQVEAAAAPPRKRLHRRPRPVGRQLEQRRRAGELLAPVGELALRAPRRRASARCQTREVGVLDRQLGQRRGPARREGAGRAPPARARSTPSDQPSATMWCRVSEQQRARRRRSRSRAARSSGPAREVERAPRLRARPAGAASASRAAAGQAGEVDERQGASARPAAITWTGSPAGRGEGGAQRLVAAHDLARGARPGPAASSAPARRTARGML